MSIQVSSGNLFARCTTNARPFFIRFPAPVLEQSQQKAACMVSCYSQATDPRKHGQTHVCSSVFVFLRCLKFNGHNDLRGQHFGGCISHMDRNPHVVGLGRLCLRVFVPDPKPTLWLPRAETTRCSQKGWCGCAVAECCWAWAGQMVGTSIRS